LPGIGKPACLRQIAGLRLVVTRHGKPVAEISPPSSRGASVNALKGSILQQEDLLSPVSGTWDSAN
jgi:antitoxin (DNA-binding transcriptional repressor) of toxin-antitoxin stability system